MKTFQTILVSIHAGIAFSAAFDTTAAECGSLGVLDVDNIPENVHADNLRSCEAHPLDLNIAFNVSSVAGANVRFGTAELSSCYTKAPYGECRGNLREQSSFWQG